MTNHSTFTESANSDPFAALYYAEPLSHLYISGRLTLLRVPSWLNPGEWIRFPNHVTHQAWHRRLDAQAFLWLRSAVNRAVESGKIAPGFEDAPQMLEHIASIAITNGSFTADEIASHCTAPEWYEFNSGLPSWADEIDSMFPIGLLTPPNKSHTMIHHEKEGIQRPSKEGGKNEGQ